MKPSLSLVRKDHRVLFSYLFSVVLSLVLCAYNTFVGLHYDVIWNKLIGIYYFFLLVVRSVLFYEEYRFMKKGIPPSKKAFIINSVSLILITLSLSVALYLMILLQEPVKISNTPVIVLSVLLLIKIGLAIEKGIDYHKERNLFNRQVFLVGCISAGFTLLTLVNTLLVLDGALDENKITLALIASCSVVFSLFGSVLFSLFDGLKSWDKEQMKKEEKK